MLTTQRRALILSQVRSDGAVRVFDLVRELGVSDMTVRRDLQALEAQGLLLRVYGGATLLHESAVHEPAFETKSGLDREAKAAIARAAAALVEPGMAVALSAGTTTYAVSRNLAQIPRITVVTNSVPAAEVLYHSGLPDQTIIVTGGVRTPSDALVGPFAVSALRAVNVDIVFLGVYGIHARAGFTSPNMLEAETDSTLVERGSRLVVTADSTKWGLAGVSTIASLGRADMIISDRALSPSAESTLREQIDEVVLVDPVEAAGAPRNGTRGARPRVVTR